MSRIAACLLLTTCLAAPDIGAEREESGVDIDPVSLSRLPVVERDTLDADGQRVYDMVVGRDRTTPLLGPGGISMHSPKVAEAMHLLNSYLRSGNSVLDARHYEVAILVAAWEFEQQYEWTAHEPAARRAGVPDVVIDAIKYDRGVDGLGADDSLIVRFARALLREHQLSSDLYAEAVKRFGQQGTFELAAVIGDYVMAGIMLNTADQRQPADRPALLPAR